MQQEHFAQEFLGKHVRSGAGDVEPCRQFEQVSLDVEFDIHARPVVPNDDIQHALSTFGCPAGAGGQRDSDVSASVFVGGGADANWSPGWSELDDDGLVVIGLRHRTDRSLLASLTYDVHLNLFTRFDSPSESIHLREIKIT